MMNRKKRTHLQNPNVTNVSYLISDRFHGLHRLYLDVAAIRRLLTPKQTLMKNYRIWLKATAIMQLIAAIMHAVTLFVELPPTNETEKQLVTLMDTYKFDFGAGFHRTMGQLLLALSACFCLVCLLGSLLNLYLLRKKVSPDIMRGVININLLVFGILFVLTVCFAFLMPVILSGMIILFLLFSRYTISKTELAK
jgi:hypothetical protein